MKTDELRYTGSRRVYVAGTLYPGIKVSMREVTQSDSVFPDGTTEPNEPVKIYDCSGSWGDESFHGRAEQGQPRLREEWIQARGDEQKDADGDELDCFVIYAAGAVCKPQGQKHYDRMCPLLFDALGIEP